MFPERIRRERLLPASTSLDERASATAVPARPRRRDAGGLISGVFECFDMPSKKD
jgi:hypothetical protein